MTAPIIDVPGAGPVLNSGFLRRAGSQSGVEALIGVLEAVMDFIDIGEFVPVDLIQGRLHGPDLQHTIGDYFAF